MRNDCAYGCSRMATTTAGGVKQLRFGAASPAKAPELAGRSPRPNRSEDRTSLAHAVGAREKVNRGSEASIERPMSAHAVSQSSTSSSRDRRCQNLPHKRVKLE